MERRGQAIVCEVGSTELGLQIIKTNGGENCWPASVIMRFAVPHLRKAVFAYPNDNFQMRQGARVILKSKE